MDTRSLLTKRSIRYYYGVNRSRNIESDRDYQKNKEVLEHIRVQELKVLWKTEKLHSTINKYIETLTFT